MEKPTLCKAIFQVRYKPELKFFDLLIPAALNLNEYKNWETDKLSVILRDYQNHCSIAIRSHDFAYEQDSDNTEMEKEKIQRAQKILPSALQIQFFNRFGYRRKYLISIKIPFESLVSILYIKLLSQNNKLRSILPVNVEDLMYRVDFIEKPYKYHIMLGPVRKHEIPRYVAYNIDNHLDPKLRDKEYLEIIEKYPEVALFADIDLFQTAEKLNLEEAETFLETATQRVSKLMHDFNAYLFAEKLEV